MKKPFLLFIALTLFVFIGSFSSVQYAHADTSITSNITATTTWNTAGGVYIIENSISINSGVTLTIDPGVIVKFKSSKSLTVNGTLDAQGTSIANIYFTSIKDDTIGGDTNDDDDATTPAASNWKYIQIKSTGDATLAYADIRYGGYATGGNLNVAGGDLTISDSKIATSSVNGIYQSSGTTTATSIDLSYQTYGVWFSGGVLSIDSSNIHNDTYGVYSPAWSGTLTITNTDFVDNTYAVKITPKTLSFIHSGNTASGGTYNGLYMTGAISSDQTWTYDTIPYIVYAVAVTSGKTLTIDPGAVVKFAAGGYINVSGTLDAQGTSTANIYFTSFKDDDADGHDTNGSAATPAAGNWKYIKINSTGDATITHAIVRYGGYVSYGSIHGNGGDLTISDSKVATSSTYGIRQASGTITAKTVDIYGSTYGFYQTGGYSFIYASSTIHDNTNGIYVTGGVSISKGNEIYDNTNYGIYVASNDAVEIDVSDIHGNTYGIYVGSGIPKIVSSNIHNNSYGVYNNSGDSSVGSNAIYDNTTYGVFNNSGSSIYGTYNYWGASDGPSEEGPGSGDAVSTNVDYSNFLTEAHYVSVSTSTGNLISSVDVGNSIDWDGDPGYWNEWYMSLNMWNDLGNVNIATDTLCCSIQDLEVSSTTRSDVPWAGQWTYKFILVDTLELNAFYLEGEGWTNDLKLNVVEHELGHGLGLGHSYLGNIMNYRTTTATTTGDQDISDYYYLWP